tara:strand:+ start:291 stop:548 length:258 start_codon:yes stop_codon:yes gene_type:complete
MPRYNYECSECGDTRIVFHLINDPPPSCNNCVSKKKMVKRLSTPLYAVENNNHNQKVGELTKEYIEQNREILEEEKRKREEYEPS